MHPCMTKRLSSRVLAISLSLVAACTTTGCTSLYGVPVRYQPTSAIVDSIELKASDLASLQKATTEADRNALQNKALAVIDLRFHQFVRSLAADRENASAASAGIGLSAATASTFVDSVAAKTNYSLLGAFSLAAFGVVDKSYFYDKTVPALVSAMGAARANVLVRIKTAQADSLSAYNGTSALNDLEEYFSAGTILAAIADISARAESDKQAAIEEIRTLDVASDDEISFRRGLTAAIYAIDDQALSKVLAPTEN